MCAHAECKRRLAPLPRSLLPTDPPTTLALCTRVANAPQHNHPLHSRACASDRELEDKLAKAEAETRDLATRLTDAAAATGGSSDELDMLKDKLAKKQKAFLALQANFEKA